MTELDLPLAAALQQAVALWRGRGEHVARLLDVSGAAGGEVRLIVDDGAFSLADVLTRGLSLGEAVTVLAPIAEGVESLARAGVEHGSIGVGAVRLDGRGAPVLGGFDTARVSGPASEGEKAAGQTDRLAYSSLARAVIAAVEESDASGRAALVTAVEEMDVTRPGSLMVFAERLLASARPEPVRVGRSAVRRADAEPIAAAREAPASLRLLRVLRGLRARLVGVRPKFWMLAGTVAAALVAALVFIPIGEDETRPAVVGSGSASATPSVGAPSTRSPSLPPADPVSAVLALRDDATAARVLDDYGDVVLLEIDTTEGTDDVLIERTDAGWRLRDTLPVGNGS